MLKSISAPIALMATMIALPAAAETIHIESMHPSIFGDENGQNRWYVGTNMQVYGNDYNGIAAGAFRLTTEDNAAFASFLAFCLEPLSPLRMPQDYSYGSLFSASVTEDLQALAQNAMAQVVDSRSAAAFQFAAWEITTESGAYDITAGDFQITGNSGASNAAETLAQGWLDNINMNVWSTGSGTHQIFNAPGVQDLLTNVISAELADGADIAAVPLPAAGMLLLAGLGGLGLSRRKRS